MVQPALQLVVEGVPGRFADPDHRGADLGERTDEMPLVGGEERLDEDDVHARNASGGMFEALMANELVPETLWALTTSLLADMEFSIFFDDRAPVNAGPAAMMRP